MQAGIKSVMNELKRTSNRRIGFVRRMLLWGILGLLASTASMLALLFKFNYLGIGCFVIADISIIVSLVFAIMDVSISTHALEIELADK